MGMDNTMRLQARLEAWKLHPLHALLGAGNLKGLLHMYVQLGLDESNIGKGSKVEATN